MSMADASLIDAILRDVDDDSPIESSKKARVRRTIPCSYCSKTLTNPNGLPRHQQEEHPESKPFLCDECGLRYEREGVLKRHIH